MSAEFLHKCFLVLLLFAAGFSCQKRTKTPSDIYVDRLVYSREDSTLYNGTLVVKDFGSSWTISFCNGIPYGSWEETEPGGGIVARGVYLDFNVTLSEETKLLLNNDTVFLDYWQEGGSNEDSTKSIKLFILKNDSFFKKHVIAKTNAMALANSLYQDTQNYNYCWLQILFENSVFEPSKSYMIEYKIIDGKLVEHSRDSTGVVQQ